MLVWQFEIRYAGKISQGFLQQQYRFLTFWLIKSGMNSYKDNTLMLELEWIIYLSCSSFSLGQKFHIRLTISYKKSLNNSATRVREIVRCFHVVCDPIYIHQLVAWKNHLQCGLWISCFHFSNCRNRQTGTNYETRKEPSTRYPWR